MFGFRRKRPLPPPNDLGRRALVARAKRLAGGDPEFLALIATADQARNRGEFGAAAAAYRQALALHPLHGGYWEQLGHCWKEQSDWVQAEVAYRTAMALGERDTDRHLEFVVVQGGGVYDRGWTQQVAAYWQSSDADLFATPPARNDVCDAIELLCDRGEPSASEIRDLLAACASRRDLLGKLLAGDEFRLYHADLIRYVAETGWGR